MFAIAYRWDAGRNHALPFGYYGDFNRVSNALASIPGITITQVWAHPDVTLEEFGFDGTNRSGKVFHIGIGENDPVRNLSGNLLINALEKDLAAQTNNPAEKTLLILP